jgi:hypothetical protein
MKWSYVGSETEDGDSIHLKRIKLMQDSWKKQTEDNLSHYMEME